MSTTTTRSVDGGADRDVMDVADRLVEPLRQSAEREKKQADNHNCDQASQEARSQFPSADFELPAQS